MSTPNTATTSVSTAGPPSDQSTELRLTKSPPMKKPTFMPTVIFAADGIDAVSAIAFVLANARRYNGVNCAVTTATASEAPAPSPIATLMPEAIEIGQVPPPELLRQHAHFDTQIEALLAGQMTVVGLAPQASRYFCDCILASMTPDDGSRQAVQAIVVAEATVPSFASATRLMSQLEEVSIRIPLSSRHLVFLDANNRGPLADWSEKAETVKKFKFTVCTLPTPDIARSIADTALASLKEIEGDPRKYMRFIVGWSTWCLQSTHALIKGAVLPTFDIPALPFDLIKVK